MSTNSQPISAAQFARALSDLPTSSLNDKAAELLNSVVHLQRSNAELQAEPDAHDYADVIEENLAVIRNIAQRIDLLRDEVIKRGALWMWDDVGEGEGTNGAAAETNGDARHDAGQPSTQMQSASQARDDRSQEDDAGVQL